NKQMVIVASALLIQRIVVCREYDVAAVSGQSICSDNTVRIELQSLVSPAGEHGSARLHITDKYILMLVDITDHEVGCVGIKSDIPAIVQYRRIGAIGIGSRQ